MAIEDKPTGGPAFPQYGASFGQQGMTLRDWFAGQALMGIIATAAHPNSAGIGTFTPPRLAVLAFEVADAMLAERSK